MGKQGGILQAWFKNFTILVFTQTFHAVFLSFIISIIGTISIENVSLEKPKADVEAEIESQNNQLTAEAVLPIISMVSIMALIKMEKMIKSIFGIEDSKFLGGVGENFAKSMAGIKSGVAMAKRTAEPIKEYKSSGDRIRKARVGQQRAMDTINSIGTGGKGGNVTNINTGGNAPQIGNGNGNQNQQQPGTPVILGADGNPISSGSSTGSAGIGGQAPVATLDKKTQDKLDAAKKSLQENKIEEELAVADRKNAAIKAFTRAGSTAASLAFGMGATENIADAVTVANLVDAPLDVVSDNFAAKQAYGSSGKKLAKDLEDARKDAINRIKKENPELSEESVEFKAKVNVAVRTEMDAKLAVDSKIPKSALKETAKVWKDAGASMSRKARKYANDVTKNGVVYGNTNIDDI